MSPIALALAAVFLAAAIVPPPGAQVQRCVATLDEMTAQIGAKWGEVPIISGVVVGGKASMVIYVNPTDSSWTIVISEPSVTCIDTTGEGLRTGPIGAPS